MITLTGNLVIDGAEIQNNRGIQNAHFGIKRDGSLFTGYERAHHHRAPVNDAFAICITICRHYALVLDHSTVCVTVYYWALHKQNKARLCQWPTACKFWINSLKGICRKLTIYLRNSKFLLAASCGWYATASTTSASRSLPSVAMCKRRGIYSTLLTSSRRGRHWVMTPLVVS